MNRNKYSAKRVTVNGEAQGFPSKLEAAIFEQLSLLEKAGEIIDLSRQAGVDLTLAEIRWKIDFSYIDAHTNKRVFAEAKGVEDERYKIFKKLWPFYGFGDLQVWKGNYRCPKVVETIKLGAHREAELATLGSKWTPRDPFASEKLTDELLYITKRKQAKGGGD